jgi:hypothetical protein
MGAVWQPGGLPGDPGEGGRQQVLSGVRQAHHQDGPPGAAQGADDGLAQHCLTQEQAQALEQHRGSRRLGLGVKQHRALVALDVAPGVEQPLPEGRAVLGQAHLAGGGMGAVGSEQLQTCQLLRGVGLDPQLEFGHSASPSLVAPGRLPGAGIRAFSRKGSF